MKDLFDQPLNLIVPLITITYTALLSFFLKHYKNKRDERRKTFIETTLQGLIDGTIEDSNDLINVYKGITNLSSEELTYKYGLNKWLREILAQLVGRKIGNDLDIQTIKEIKIKLSNFITANEKISPFSDLPDTERNILSDISSFAETNEKESIERKLKELSSVIQTRYDEQKKIQDQNKWSVPLAIIGLVLTIVFGILSLF